MPPHSDRKGKLGERGGREMRMHIRVATVATILALGTANAVRSTILPLPQT